MVLNKALFDKEGVEMVGVVLNKVMPDHHDQIAEFTRAGFERLGIDLMGIIPVEPILADPSLGQICSEIKGGFLNEPAQTRRLVRRVVIGAMSSSHVMEHFAPGTLVVSAWWGGWQTLQICPPDHPCELKSCADPTIPLP